MKCWFALQVKPRHEKTVSAALQSKQYEEFLPLRRVRQKWSDRFKMVELPLLAGYTFCRFEFDERVRILRTPGVRAIVGRGPAPTPVEDAEIEALQKLMRTGLPAEPCRYLQIGEGVSIDRGPLTGLRGLLLQTKGKHRLVISVTLLQRSVSVEVDHAWVKAAARPETRPMATANTIRPQRSGGAVKARAAAAGSSSREPHR